jgi:outer membrane lipoprotein SlyB
MSLAGLLALVLLLGGCSSTSQPGQAVQPDSAKKDSGVLGGIFESTKPITVPEGTALHVVLDQSLSSGASRSGDEFEASVSEPIVVDGKTVIPKGAHAKGRVVDAKSSGRLHSPARLEITLTSVEVGGKWYDIDTSDAGRTGKNHNKHNLIFIGGGAAGGALLGGLIGGGKGALIGSAVGAGGGTAAAAATGKQEVSLPAESRLAFRLAKPVTIPVKG